MLPSGEIVPGLLPTQTSLAFPGSLAQVWQDECKKAIAMVYATGVKSGFARTTFRLLVQYGWGQQLICLYHYTRRQSQRQPSNP